MIKRYESSKISEIWSDRAKFQRFWEVEKAFLIAFFEISGNESVADSVRHDLNVLVNDEDVLKIEEIEKETRHDFLAFLKWLEAKVKSFINPKLLHLGMTSSDAIDTAMALAMRETIQVVDRDLNGLKEVLTGLAERSRKMMCVGRTHGMHAEPTTFALKVAVWMSSVNRAKKRLNDSWNYCAYGKMSGPVGNYSNIDPNLEIRVLRELSLNIEPVSNQIIPRDRYVDFVYPLVMVTNCIESIAMEIRHLSRTEVGEVSEAFESGQKGSSSMPHKKNPIGSENLCGIARYARGLLTPVLENQSLWHERDISHSSVERMVLPDISHCASYAVQKMTRIIKHLEVYPERMLTNLKMTNGLVYSGQALSKYPSNSREEAYKFVQTMAFENQEMFQEAFQEKTGILLTDEEYQRHESLVLKRVLDD